jgi:DNA processing protein
MARKLAADLSDAGFVVVSGLARGVDAAAHAAALDGGTVAVLAGGVDVIYPAENTQLFHDIGRSGLRLSDQPMGLQPQARHFPARNRIIAALSRGVVVIEAATKSGSLITAEQALSLGREVLAVPGHPFDARASGCNMLLRDGATLVRGADDVVAALGALPVAPRPVQQAPVQHAPVQHAPAPLPVGPSAPAQRTLRDTAALHSQILARLGPSPVAEDQLIRDLALAPRLIAPALMDLELDGRIARQPGGLLARVD